MDEALPPYEKGRAFKFVKLVFKYGSRTYNQTLKDYQLDYKKKLIARDGGLIISEEVIEEFE